MAAEKARLEAASARYEQWSTTTTDTRETAGTAKAELQRRGREPANAEPLEPQSTLGWWRELEADVEAVDRDLARQQQTTIDDGQPCRQPATRRRNRKPSTHPNPRTPCLNSQRFLRLRLITTASARHDWMSCRHGPTTQRLGFRRSGQSSTPASKYTTRMEREAQAQPEADWQAEAPDEIEMEP